MQLVHTPGYTTYHPDTVELFKDNGQTVDRTFTVLQDHDAEDPRGWTENEDAALWAYRQSKINSSISSNKPDGNLAIDAFDFFYRSSTEADLDDDRALTLTRRYLAIFHPEKNYRIETATVQGYSQSDRLDVVCAVAPDYGNPKDYINEFRQWTFGDVWVVLETNGESLGGIYADGPEEAVTYYLESTSQGNQS